MTTFFNRKGYEYWTGRRLPPDVAFVERDWHGRTCFITWAEVHAARNKRREHALYWKRFVEPWRAVKVEVAFFNQRLMGGWQAFLDGIAYHVWIDRDGPHYKEQLMSLFPLTLFGWEEWKVAFARSFARRRQDRRPVGVDYLWRRGHLLACRPTTDSTE